MNYIDTDNKLINNKKIINISNVKKYLIKNDLLNKFYNKPNSSDTNFNINNIEPFVILLSDNKIDYKLNIYKIFRAIPGRRIVFYGELMDCSNSSIQEVVIKLFVSNLRYSRDFDNYIKGYRLLCDNKINTPKVIISKKYEKFSFSIIINNYIKNSQNIKVKENINNTIIEAIVDLHRCGLYQEDFHLNNFIINRAKTNSNNSICTLDSTKVYCIDCDSIKYSNNPKKIHQNFSLFLAQLDINRHKYWFEYSRKYLKLLNKKNKIININFDKLSNQITDDARGMFNNNINNYLKKSLRTSSKFVKIKIKNNKIKSRKIKILEGYSKRDFYNNFLKNKLIDDYLLSDNPDKFISQYCVKKLKQGNTAHVYLINYLDKFFVIKKYLSKSLLNKIIANLKYFFVKPRCLKSWLNANFLEGLNIDTPSPLACIKLKKYGLINESFFIMDYAGEYNRFNTVHDILNNRIINHIDINNIFKKLNDLLTKFKYLRVIHNDFKTVNLAYINNKLIVLDLDAMQRYNYNIKLLNKLYYYFYSNVKDLKRLKRCFENNPELLRLYNLYINQ